MPDDHDYSADPPRRDPSREPLDASRKIDWDESSARREVPKLVRTAGMIWIVSGWLMLPLLPIGTLVGIAFIYVGVQSRKGTAKDTLGNAFGSIFLGGSNLLCIVGMVTLSAALSPSPWRATRAGGQPLILDALALIFFGGMVLYCLGLILAGVLALLGRAEYMAYRRAGMRSASIND